MKRGDYFVKFIQNWNNSKFTGSSSFSTTGSQVAFVTYGSVNVIYFAGQYGLFQDSDIGSEFDLSGSLSNDATYTITSVGDDGSNVSVSESFVSDENTTDNISLTSTDITFYPSSILKDTRTDTDIKIISDEVKFDPQKYIGEDFFISEPREAKLEFLLDSSDWLKDNFSTDNIEEEINSFIYYDEDGEILESDYPWLEAGTGEINNTPIAEKEVLLQQISKIVIEIHQMTSNTASTKVFTGFVDKSKTKMDNRKITIEAVCILDIIDKFAEQLIKDLSIYSKDADDCQYIVSDTIATELFDKIKDFTGINFDDNNAEYLYTRYGSIDTMAEDMPISPDLLYVNNSSNPALFLSPVAVGDYNKIIASNLDECYYIYRTYLFITKIDTYTGGSGIQLLYTDYTAKCVVMRRKLDKDLIVGEKEIYSIDTLTTWRVPDDNVPNINDLKEMCIEKETAFLSAIGYAQAFKDTDNEENNYVYFYEESDTTNYYNFYRADIEYYSCVIPIYSDVYTYKDLLRMIFFVNAVAMYSTADGNIEMYRKDDLLGDSSVTITDRDICKEGFEIVNFERETEIGSEALDMIWVDYKDDSVEWKKNYNHFKDMYSYMFNNKYTQKIKAKIFKTRISDLSELTIGLGYKLIYGNSYWLVNACPLNNTGFLYEVEGIRVRDEELTSPQGKKKLVLPSIETEYGEDFLTDDGNIILDD